MGYDEAIKSGAMALFGEKYGSTGARDEVRRFLHGTLRRHPCAAHLGDIGLFKIVSEGGVAAGVRRIEAVTGAGALAWVHKPAGHRCADVADMTKGSLDDY